MKTSCQSIFDLKVQSMFWDHQATGTPYDREIGPGTKCGP